MSRAIFGGGAAALLAATAALSEPGYSAQERALVMALLTIVQPRSFAAHAEFCGYVVRDRAGRLRVTGPVEGDAGTCSAPWPDGGTVLASWHTHGGFDPATWNEVPSLLDLEIDHLEGVDGWIATPGGRLWHVDGPGRVAELVCGPACLPVDDEYDAAEAGEVGTRYTWDMLIRKFASE